MKCPITRHEHDLQVLEVTWGWFPMWECPTTGSRWIEVPEDKKAGVTSIRMSHKNSASEEIGDD